MSTETQPIENSDSSILEPSATESTAPDTPTTATVAPTISEDNTEAPTSEETAEIIEPEKIFLDDISEDLRDDPSLQDFKDINGLAKSYINLNKKLGNSINIPTEDASDEAKQAFYDKIDSLPEFVKVPSPDNQEEINKFYNKLGRPEKPEDYDFTMDDPALNEIAASLPDQQKKFAEFAHSQGLSKSAVKALTQYQLEDALAQQQQALDYKEQSIQTLKQQWGGDYDARLQGANAVLKMYNKDHPNAIQDLMNTAGSNPALISMMSDLANVYKETGNKGLEQSISYGMTPEKASQQIDEIYTNLQHPFHIMGHPDHEKALEKMEELYKIKAGG